MIKYADLHKEYLECRKDVDMAIARCIKNSSYINGPEVLAFEQAWADHTQSRACAGVSSGTSALMLALDSLGIGPGDEVIVPTMSFISTAEVVSQLGATPVFVDIDPRYYTLDLTALPGLLNTSTKAIVFVDLYGQTLDIDALKTIAGDIPLIEDAAQSAGCQYIDRPVGDLVYATCFSFYPGKNLSAIGDAGAITGSEEMCHLVRMLRDHGRLEKYKHLVRGWNERLDGLQAAVLHAKIPYLLEWNLRRQEHASVYRGELAFVTEVDLPANNPVSSHVYNQFVITTNERDELKQYLAHHGIETGIQFPRAMHQQPVYLTNLCLPVSESLAASCLSLPVHAQMSHRDVISVCDHIKKFFRRDYNNVHVTISN